MSQKKIALITGANRGIGLETARQLGKQDIKVLIGARSEEKGKKSTESLRDDGIEAEFIKLDVDDEATHAAAAKEIGEKYGKLDILSSNAGVFRGEEFDANGAPVPASQTSQERFRATFDYNLCNTVSVTQALLPLVKKAEQGPSVFLSSGLCSLGLQSDPASPFYD